MQLSISEVQASENDDFSISNDETIVIPSIMIKSNQEALIINSFEKEDVFEVKAELKKFLLVDDHIFNIEAMKVQLRQQGVDIE